VATSAARRANFTQSWMCEKFSTPLPPRHRFRRRVIMLERSAGEEAKDAAERCSGNPQNRSRSSSRTTSRGRSVVCSLAHLHHQYLSAGLCLIPSRPCHQLSLNLKIWRHLDCSPGIIFRFQLIYHCRARKKTKKTFVLVSTLGREFFLPGAVSPLKRVNRGDKEGGEKRKSEKTQKQHKLRATSRAF
jgi:hypothetical protein